MTETSKNKIWKIRTIKNYPDAHNHLLVGKVLEITDSYVRIHCRTYHFGRIINRPEDVQIGNLMNRVVPWSRIEVINELPPTFDYIRNTITANKEGEVIFQDDQHTHPVGSGTRYEVRY
ncbi:MAG: hypothetical protein JXA81_10330 [Sedimentisphaerales bacterium]|nr:hypothetical protein [Sedimentisphaerales bacterium]